MTLGWVLGELRKVSPTVAIEIERKFLLTDSDWMRQMDGPPASLYQFYLAIDEVSSTRIRLIEGTWAVLTTKRKTDRATVRDEFEFAVDYEQALRTVDECVGQPIEKYRYRLAQAELTWEVDYFSGANQGLMVAEIELPSEDYPFEIPSWIGAEISHDPCYTNQSLALHPYSEWRD
jgi:adenylate cyclase